MTSLAGAAVLAALLLAATAPAASRIVGNGASRVRLWVGSGISFRIIFVTIPNVPSEPTISCVRLYPVTFFSNLPPV